MLTEDIRSVIENSEVHSEIYFTELCTNWMW